MELYASVRKAYAIGLFAQVRAGDYVKIVAHAPFTSAA